MGEKAEQSELESILLTFSHGVRNELWARNMRLMIESYGWMPPSRVKRLVEEARSGHVEPDTE